MNHWFSLHCPMTGLAGLVLGYIGPGTGLSAIGALLALIAAVFLAMVGFIWYPIKRLFRRRKPAPPEDEKSNS